MGQPLHLRGCLLLAAASYGAAPDARARARLRGPAANASSALVLKDRRLPAPTSRALVARRRLSGDYAEVAKLVAGDAALGDVFGYSVAINGNTIVVGALRDTDGGTNSGYYATAFDKDIGDWAVHSVTSMYWMFGFASAFNQDIGGWAVDSVTTMQLMFAGDTSAFDQDLGWCVDDDVDLDYAFDDTPCASTSCGVVQGTCAPTPAPPIINAARRLSGVSATLLALTLV